MSGAIMNKVWDLFGEDPQNDAEDENEYELEDYETEVDEVEERRLFGKRNNKSNIVSLPQAQQIKMVISQPTSFEQSESICDLLKEKKSVIVNLEYVNKDVARRIIDVISGAVHALDGHIQKVSNSIFVVAPSNYDIENQFSKEKNDGKFKKSYTIYKNIRI